jgi:DNA-binding NarL/FixJ family response regulator
LLAAAEGRSMVPAAALSGVADAVPLTDREREVFLLVRRGLRDKQIAEQLVISVKTVEKHVGAVFRKTGARNRTELAALGEIPTIRTGSFPDAVRVRHA